MQLAHTSMPKHRARLPWQPKQAGRAIRRGIVSLCLCCSGIAALGLWTFVIKAFSKQDMSCQLQSAVWLVHDCVCGIVAAHCHIHVQGAWHPQGQIAQRQTEAPTPYNVMHLFSNALGWLGLLDIHQLLFPDPATLFLQGIQGPLYALRVLHMLHAAVNNSRLWHRLLLGAHFP